jgi:twitching motility protein PilT
VDLTQLLAFTMQNKASDLHLSAGSPPVIRVHGILKRVKADPLSSDDIRTMLYSVMTEDQRAVYEKDMELDFAIALGEKARFRVNGFTSRLGSCSVFRTIPTEVPTMEQLDLPPVMRRFAELEKGIILVTGPTGSGKSTTLASMINHINLNYPKHILTIEDPVEFFHTSKKALINHREVGTDTNSFARALKSSLREDPDVILVGEMRDYETISLALTAAETGHLVFATLHTGGAIRTIDRIVGAFPPDQQAQIRMMFSESLRAIVSQRLVTRADGNGRVPAIEVLLGSRAVANLIRDQKTFQLRSVMQTGATQGMVMLDVSLAQLVRERVITREAALEQCDDPKLIPAGGPATPPAPAPAAGA